MFFFFVFVSFLEAVIEVCSDFNQVYVLIFVG